MADVRIFEGKHYNEIKYFGARYVTKSYSCNYCPYNSKREDYMLRHLEKEHGLTK